MPKVYRDILRTINIPDDEGYTMWKGIQQNKVIGASDGSVVGEGKRAKGGYAYSIQQYDNDSHRIIGYGATPLSTKISSMTSETYGVMASLIIIKGVFQQYCKDDRVDGKICIITDNQEVVNRCRKRPTPMNISETLVAEYDIWVMLWEIIDVIPMTIEVKWICGHQNENEKNEIIHGPFTREVQLNIDMDNIAAMGVKLHEENFYQMHMYYSAAMAVYDPDGYQVNDINSFLVEHINGPIMETYIKDKYQ